MFKQTLMFAAFVGCALAWTIPDQYQALAKETLEQCSKETNTDIEFIMRMRQATELPAVGSEDETKYKPYTHCTFAHAGVFKDGVFHEDVAEKLIEGLQEIYNKPLHACKNERGENNIESAWKMVRCFYEHVEDKSHFFLY